VADSGYGKVAPLIRGFKATGRPQDAKFPAAHKNPQKTGIFSPHVADLPAPHGRPIVPATIKKDHRMLNRRDFAALLGAAALPGAARADTGIPFYASVGPNLTRHVLDVDAATLTPQESVTLPANLQYAWPHPSQKTLYVIASNGQPPSGPTGVAGTDKRHYAFAFQVGPDGKLTQWGEPALLAARPVHCCTDPSGRFLLIAYNIPSMVTVHRLESDLRIGAVVQQANLPEFGIYAHQVRVTPSGKTATLCSRGNDPTATKAEDPGHIEVFGFRDGQLSARQSIAPHGNGIGFGPRHLDFDRRGRFAYVSLERENSICVFAMDADGAFGAEPLFLKNALADPDGKAKYPGQTSGPIHVHPGGHFVYQTNRGSGTVEAGGRKVWNGGENNIAVWRIDPASGEPVLIQHADAHGFELRTFTIDPGGRVLIAASTTSLAVREGDTVRAVSAGLSIYRIGADGKLDFVRKLDVDTSQGVQFWCGLLTMA
jgi:6-phosphogluconolactonase (cycloisomerase 2 family)